jgi:hypothetical protein
MQPETTEHSMAVFAEALPNDNKITLKKPLQIGDGQYISEVELIEPTAAAMKGLNRFDILMMNDDAHKKLLPRISHPSITAAIFDRMSLKDTQKIMTKVTSFFVDDELDSPVT